MKKIFCIPLTIFIFYSLAFAKDDILSKIDRRLNPESFESYRKLINIEPDGTKKEFILYTIKKGKDKVASLFLSPKSDQGRSTLRLGENMWLYIPGIAKPLRIASMQSVTGGVFNNSDIMRVDFSVEYTVVSQKKEENYLILDLKAKNDSVAYEKLIMKVKNDLPVQIQCYAGGILIKTITYSKIKDFGNGIVRPAIMETTSPLQKGYKSVIVFARLKPRKLKDSYFTLDFLPKLEDIRK
ncbi:MAG: outer membrane lipoprotein-sorting protein [Desulfonauticus sp.]|nr:outer membrane lipoprotein-sorting protein [Desulfonauticus sp.]